MLTEKDIKGKENIFIKGFAKEVEYDTLVDPLACEGEFIAIITDMVTSGYIRVKSATQDSDGQWVLESVEGETYSFDEEPKEPRKMINGKVVIPNFVPGSGEGFCIRKEYNEIVPDSYPSIEREIAEGVRLYQLKGIVNGAEIVTSVLSKFWTDPNGWNHGITKSGSHYIF